MRPLVILRPEPGASSTAEKARAMGMKAVTLPLFEIRPLPWTAPEPTQFDALLMTSANAARFGGPELANLRALPVHAVGEATAKAARESGFQVASVGAGGVERLDMTGGLRLLHLAGRHRRPIAVAKCIAVYESAELPPPPELARLSKAVVAVHSRRAGRRLSELVGDRSRLTIVAISGAAGEACGNGWEKIEVADAPRDSSLLALAARLCEDLGE